MKNFTNIEYRKGVYLDLSVPETEQFDLFIYMHGGGLVNGRKDGYPPIFSPVLEKKNVALVSVDYSLYPNAKYPDFIVDCAHAVKWAFDNISKYGKCNRIFVGGSSAGGYISMMLCFCDKFLNDVGLKPTDIAGYILDAGQPTTHFNVLKELGIDQKRIIVDEKAPLYYVGLKENYSPMLFIVSTNDMFNRYEQTMLTINTLKHFGHENKVSLKVFDGTHCHYVTKLDEDGLSVFAKTVAEFIENVK